MKSALLIAVIACTCTEVEEPCARLVFADLNPDVIPGGPGADYYRSIAIDGSACKADAGVQINLWPSSGGEINTKTLVEAGGCSTLGGAGSGAAEITDLQNGNSAEWEHVIVEVVEGGHSHWYSLPDDLSQADKDMLVDPLVLPKVPIFFSDAWHIGADGDAPHCQ